MNKGAGEFPQPLQININFMIARKEFTEWIMSQPDDRSVNMTNSWNPQSIFDDCGCAMVQYASDHGIPITHMGSHGFYLRDKMITRLEVEIGNLFPCAWAAIKTFGELKEKIVLDIKK